jgi:signal transduction histidine kinase
MRKLCLPLLCLLFAVSGQAQGQDSLLRLLPIAKQDTNKIKLLLDIQRSYFYTDIDSALYYNKLCEALIEEIEAKKFKHSCYHDFVKIYHAKGDYKTALSYCLQSIDIAKQNDNRFQEATSYRAIFNIYHNLSMNDSAVKYGVYSLKLTEEINDTVNLATNFGNLSWLYMDLNQYDKAIEYGKKGIEAGERYVDTNGLLVSINNLSLSYQRTGENEKAIELIKRQLELAKQLNRRRSIERALINLAAVCYNLGDVQGLKTARLELNKHLSESSVVDPKIKTYQFIVNADYAILQKNFNEAERQLMEGLKVAEADSIIDPLLDIYITLSMIKAAQHDFKAAHFYNQKWDDLSTSLHEEELSEYAMELEAKYETEKKEAQIQLQQATIEQKNTLNFILVGSAIVLLIISLLSYRNYTHKQKLQQQRIAELETQQQLTATEAVLKGEEQERTRLAKDLHDGLGGMLSGIKYSLNTMKGNLIMTPDNAQAFERSMDMLDSSIKEMRRVAHNMMPEALVKFGLDTALSDFCNDINQSGVIKVAYQSIGLSGTSTLSQTTAIAVYRIVQELLNNVIKHAVAKSVIVQVSKTNDDIAITVEDDGKGFDPAILKGSKGMGWNNIESRITYLKGKLDIQSEPGKGTSVLIEFKNP